MEKCLCKELRRLTPWNSLTRKTAFKWLVFFSCYHLRLIVRSDPFCCHERFFNLFLSMQSLVFLVNLTGSYNPVVMGFQNVSFRDHRLLNTRSLRRKKFPFKRTPSIKFVNFSDTFKVPHSFRCYCSGGPSLK